MSSYRVHVGAVVAPLNAAVAELLECLSVASAEARQVVLDRLDSISELVRFDVDSCAAAGAGDIRIVLQPSNGFLELLAAARAGKFEGVVV